MNFAPVLQIVQKIPENYYPCLYLSMAKFRDLMSCGSKDIYSKMHPAMY